MKYRKKPVVIEAWQWDGNWLEECTGCSCAIAEDTIKEAIAAWNRRDYYDNNYKKRKSRV